MRTTLTLDPDVALKVRERLADSSVTLKDLINEALRAGLAASVPKSAPRFRVKPQDLQLRPGVDPDKLNQWVDDAEVEQRLRGRRHGRS
ncbi:MAG: hypothetical protein MUC42_07675 [Bryobacter sp.]|jgi:hypothetical protein|nr:hypothetical protein [Bryobacter sp.]